MTADKRLMKPSFRRAVIGLSAVLFLVAAAGCLNAIRKAMSLRGCEDFALVYSSARAWRTGHSPYATPVLGQVWTSSGGPAGMGPNNYAELSLYPPCTLAVLAPWTYPRWPAARDAWAVTNLILILAAMVAVLDLAGLAWTDWRAPALLAAMLAMGAFRNSIIYGQPAAPASAAILVAAALARRRQDLAAALFLSFALAVKLQLAGPFLAYYLCRRRWKLAGICIAALVLLGAVGVLRMHLAGVDFVHDWMANLGASTSPGGINDASPSGPTRFQLVNLQVILTSLMPRSIANALTLLLVGIVTVAVLLRVLLQTNTPSRRTELGELSLLAALGLLVVYHRWYDTGTLVFLLAWAAVGLDHTAATRAQPASGDAPTSRAALWQALMAVLLIFPFFGSLAIRIRPTPHFQHLSSTQIVWPVAPPPGPWWLELLVLPNQVWALVGVLVLLLCAGWRRPSRQPALSTM